MVPGRTPYTNGDDLSCGQETGRGIQRSMRSVKLSAPSIINLAVEQPGSLA